MHCTLPRTSACSQYTCSISGLVLGCATASYAPPALRCPLMRCRLLAAGSFASAKWPKWTGSEEHRPGRWQTVSCVCWNAYIGKWWCGGGVVAWHRFKALLRVLGGMGTVLARGTFFYPMDYSHVFDPGPAVPSLLHVHLCHVVYPVVASRTV